MTTPYEKSFQIPTSAVDRFDRLKASHILAYLQEVSGEHSTLLGASRTELAELGLFWAVIRHRVEITRLPKAGEIITVRTWPMPTTRTAYPRSAIFYDERGNECLRCITLWVLMDANTRAMVLPGKSGVSGEGLLTGTELAAPGSIVPKSLVNSELRQVRFSDLDVNGHMNNCRYLDWAMDLLPSDFYAQRSLTGFTICYLAEATEKDTLELQWELENGPCITVNGIRKETEPSAGKGRMFSAQLQF